MLSFRHIKQTSKNVADTTLSSDAILKMTKVELELIPDDPKQESKNIYLDVNNLHGYAMSKFLQTSGLKWIDGKEFDLSK